MHPRQASVLAEIQAVMTNLRSATGQVVLWQYTDPEGNHFWLDRKVTTALRSPYGGQFTPKPKKILPSQLGKILKDEEGAAQDAEDSLDLKGFAAKVIKVALSPQCKKFHGDRAFIGSVKDLGFPTMARTKFDALLIEAHRSGLLRLARADLVGAMDPEDVRNSEVKYQNSTFNFVALDDLVPPPWKR